MSKSRAAYPCSQCGTSAGKWQGRCRECGAWNTLREIVLDTVTPPKALGARGGWAGVAESHRVLRPGGWLDAVVHHAESLPARIAREECAHVDWLLQVDGLYDRAGAMLEPMSRAATAAGREALKQDATAAAVCTAFNDVLKATARRIEDSRYSDVLLEQRDVVMALPSRTPRSVRRLPARNSSSWRSRWRACASRS